jgi:hypothetical protein
MAPARHANHQRTEKSTEVKRKLNGNFIANNINAEYDDCEGTHKVGCRLYKEEPMKTTAILLIILALVSALLVAGQDLTDRSEEPNWCYAGEPWAGRCIHDDPAIQEFFWKVGWCMAHEELGLLDTTLAICIGGPLIEPVVPSMPTETAEPTPTATEEPTPIGTEEPEPEDQ